jgi:tetratricopeptide (TPR) repeat protein
MLAAYGQHRSTAQALEQLFGVSQADFEASYRQLVERTIAAAGPSIAEPRPTLLALQTRVAEAPDDADAAAELARAWLDRDDKPQARLLALAARKIKPNHQLAAYVRARLQLTIGDTDGAVTLLDKALDRNAPQEDLLALLAALRLKADDAPAARSLYELGEAKLPHSDRWLKGLVKIHLDAGNDAKLAPLLRRLAELEPDNATARKKLAELALAAKDFKAAADYARHGIYADVADAPAHAAFARALAGLGDHAAAVGEFATALQLDDTQPDWLAGLARSQIALGNLEEARTALERLKRLDAKHPHLDSLQKAIQP